MSAPPTLSKLSTETVPVSDIVIGDGTLVKVGHLNSLDLQCTLQKGKRNYIFTESLNLQFYTIQGCEFFQFVFDVSDNKLVLELTYSASDYYNSITISNLQESNKITCLGLFRVDSNILSVSYCSKIHAS